MNRKEESTAEKTVKMKKPEKPEKTKKPEKSENPGKNTRRPLRWSMISLLLLCWFLPLMLLIFIMVFSVSGKINRQIEHTITTSLDKAAEICTLRLEDCVTASKNASYIPTIRDGYEVYQRSGDFQTLNNQVTLFLGQQYQYNDNFCAALLVFVQNPGKVYYTYNNSTKATYDNIRYFELCAREKVMDLAAGIDTATVLLNLDGRLYLVRNLVTSSFEPYAVLALELNSSSIFESMDSVWGYRTVEIYRNGEIVAKLDRNAEDKSRFMKVADSSRESGKEARSALENAAADSRVFWSGKTIYASKRVKKDQDRTTYLVELNRSEIFTEIWGVYLVFLVLLLFMVPLLISIFYFFHKKITVPLRALVDASSQIKEGNYGYEITSMADSQEFYYTDEVFNSMSGQLKKQFEKIYLEEIALRDARIMALQSQINPHFLNNTLEIINWEARLNENYKVSAMIEALSTMLEATMNRKTRSMVRLSEELSYVDAYLYIISQRFGEKFQFHREVEERLMSLWVPRLIIQPIVENAVEHGMDITRKGTVRLRVFQPDEKSPVPAGIPLAAGMEVQTSTAHPASGTEKPAPDTESPAFGTEKPAPAARRPAMRLCIEIEDNGVLTEEEHRKIEKLLSEEPDVEKERHVSLGIRNVDQRLRIIYGQDCGLTIYSNEQGHTVSRLTLRPEQGAVSQRREAEW